MDMLDAAISALAGVGPLLPRVDPSNRRTSPAREQFLAAVSAINFVVNVLRIVRVDEITRRGRKPQSDECSALVRELLTLRGHVEGGRHASAAREHELIVKRAKALRAALAEYSED